MRRTFNKAHAERISELWRKKKIKGYHFTKDKDGNLLIHYVMRLKPYEVGNFLHLGGTHKEDGIHVTMLFNPTGLKELLLLESVGAPVKFNLLESTEKSDDIKNITLGEEGKFIEVSVNETSKYAELIRFIELSLLNTETPMKINYMLVRMLIALSANCRLGSDYLANKLSVY